MGAYCIFIADIDCNVVNRLLAASNRHWSLVRTCPMETGHLYTFIFETRHAEFPSSNYKSGCCLLIFAFPYYTYIHMPTRKVLNNRTCWNAHNCGKHTHSCLMAFGIAFYNNGHAARLAPTTGFEWNHSNPEERTVGKKGEEITATIG